VGKTSQKRWTLATTKRSEVLEAASELTCAQRRAEKGLQHRYSPKLGTARRELPVEKAIQLAKAAIDHHQGKRISIGPEVAPFLSRPCSSRLSLRRRSRKCTSDTEQMTLHFANTGPAAPLAFLHGAEQHARARPKSYELISRASQGPDDRDGQIEQPEGEKDY